MANPVTSRRLVAIACMALASTAMARAADTVALKGGAVALDLKTPSGQDLSSGAVLKLDLPAGSVQAQATTSVGLQKAAPDFWRKDAAQVQAKVAGPFGTSLSMTGEDNVSLSYRAPESIGASDTATHVVRSENQNANISLVLPIHPMQVTVGSDMSTAVSQDTTKTGSAGVSNSVATNSNAAFVNADWQPADWVKLEGGAAARVATIDVRDGRSHSGAYRSMDPHVTVTVTPWNDTIVNAKLEHVVSPYDAATFSAASRAGAGAASVRPDSAWQMAVGVQQKVGIANLSATYTAARQGSATEFADVGGVQAPAATPLRNRDAVTVSLSVPLASVGLPRTDLTSEAQWQSSAVVDPITQKLRDASGQVPEKFSLRMAHSLPADRLSFGVTGEFSGSRTSYQVSEVSTTSPGASLGAFVTYKPGDNYVLDLNVSGLYGSTTKNDFYRGTRDASLVDHSVLQDNSGPMLSLALRKPF